AIFEVEKYVVPYHTGFRYAIGRHNRDPRQQDRFKLELDATISQISRKNNYELASTICGHMNNGSFVLFGVIDSSSVEVVESYSRRFHMPFVSPGLSFTVDPDQPNFELYLRPDHTKAVIDMVKFYGWRRVHYLYDSNEGLMRIEQILSTFTQQHYNVSIYMHRLEDVSQAHDELRMLDRSVLEFYKCIILDLSSPGGYEIILKQISEVGMNKFGYHYLLGSMGFINLPLERLKYGGVNLTGFQLLDPDNPQLQHFLRLSEEVDRVRCPVAEGNWTTHEVALSIDATNVIVHALEEMLKKDIKVFQHTFRRGIVYNHNKTKGVPCYVKDALPWMHGEAIMSALKQVDIKGLSGRVAFDEQGRRRDYKLDVYELRVDEGLRRIGNWTPNHGFNEVVIERATPQQNYTMTGKRLIVTTIESPPFLMFKKPAPDGKPLVGNDKYEGYCVELAEHLKRIINIDYIFRIVRDGNYGQKLKNGTWDGMIGELTRSEANIAIAPLTITSQREEVVDFSKPFMNVGISIMIKKPEKQKPGVFSFMEPLSLEIWTCIIFAFLGISLGLWLVSRFSQCEWHKDTTINGEQMVNDFSISNSIWFSLGALMQQGSDECPRSLSGRIIGGVWWFFVLIIISSYTANLAAFLTIERMLTPIESVEDLAKQTEIAYGTIGSGTSKQFFKDSNNPTYQRMWAFMSSNPSVFVKLVKDGVHKVRNSKGKYAFLLESSSNIYINNRKPCDTMMIGGTLDSKGFGIATPKGSPIRDSVTLAVLELKEEGSLHKLYQKWWYEKGQCGFDSGGDSKKRELSLSNVAGVFYILICGLALAIALGILEFVCKLKCHSNKGEYIPGRKSGDGSSGDKDGPGHLCPDYMPEKAVSTFTYTAPQLIAFESYADGNSHTQV
ncbi:glutamate receptor, partial [Argonauta hians]